VRKLLRAWLWRDLLAEYSEGLWHGMEGGRNLAKFQLRKRFNELELKGDSVPNLYTLEEILKVVNSID